METLKFKTNIKCNACVATVTPFLNDDKAIETWQVDLLSPQRTLEVETSRSADEIAGILKKAGYLAEEIA
ncbi:heavy-metal-associated domain-containing protein [Dyadobacter luticola]|uniref:Heavy-metal-associated domain-containing protein n=1 Tax=Dyadobacter luticola TaxID=1979387 RepID=A0A5R9KRX3_9BACT|nr:heavy-metal-associated domain-containing protein [Dyadobacter luticola]TLU98836.1 heavy-metal-associated domain-containing protein [Dyadobacter luticola]